MKTTTMSSQLIDEKVTLTMIVCCVLSLMVLAFRYKNSEPEYPVTIGIKKGSLYTNEVISFIAAGKNIKPGTQLYWDFGDKSNLHDTGMLSMHFYKIPGRYDVSVTINKNRKETKTIYIIPAPQVVDKRSVAQFSGPDRAVVGDPVTFQDATPGATEWAWNFGETDKVDATNAKAKYTFRTSGPKRVTIKVNGNIIGTTTVIVEVRKTGNSGQTQTGSGGQVVKIVKEGPGEKTLAEQTEKQNAKKPDSTASTVAIKMAPPIKESGIENLLRGVADGKKDAASFSPYVCDNLLVTVNVNGKKGMSLTQFCTEFKNDVGKAENIKNLNVTFNKDENTNCIKSINVNYKKYKFIGKLLH
jgi:PKD repeat protein